MTSVATTITAPVTFSCVFGIPAVARVIAGSSGASVKFYPYIAATFIAPQRPAPAGFLVVPADDKPDDHRDQHGTNPAELPAIGRIPVTQSDLHPVQKPHV